MGGGDKAKKIGIILYSSHEKNLRIRGLFVFFNFVRHFLKNLRDFANTNTNVRSWYSMLRSCFAVYVRQFGEYFLPIDIA